MAKPITTKDIVEIAEVLNNKLGEYKYALRGTASLAIQEYKLNIGDIDIICDETVALSINTIFKDSLVNQVQFAQTHQFKSYFGEIRINAIKVEIMGNFQIKNSKGIWSKIYCGIPEETNYIKYQNITIPCTKANVELKMYIQMERYNVYHKLKSQIEERANIKLFA